MIRPGRSRERHTRGGATLVLLVAGAVVIATGIGLYATCPEPAPRAGSSLESYPTIRVEGSPSGFQRKVLHARPGIRNIRLRSTDGERYELAFTEPRFAYVHLQAPGPRPRSRIELFPGDRATIYDPLPGHRQAGLEATIVVDRPAPSGS